MRILRKNVVLTVVVISTVLVYFGIAFAGIAVSINKTTGKLIESQKGGLISASTLDILLQNAINARYKAKDVEVKFVTDAEFRALLEAVRPEPTQKDKDRKLVDKEMRKLAIDSLKAKGKISADYEE